MGENIEVMIIEYSDVAYLKYNKTFWSPSKSQKWSNNKSKSNKSKLLAWKGRNNID